MIEDKIRIQNYLDKLENHLEVNKKDFIKENSKVILLNGSNQLQKHKIRFNWVHCKLQTVSNLRKLKRMQNKKQNI